MLTDDNVLELRQAARTQADFYVGAYAIKFNVARCTIYQAMRGKTFSHLNEQSPPVFTKPDHTANKKRAFAFHQDGKSYGYISRTMGFTKSTIIAWCQELKGKEPRSPPALLTAEQKEKVDHLYAQGETRRAIADKLQIAYKRIAYYFLLSKPKIIRKRRVLTDEEVIHIRREIASTGAMNLLGHARKYDCTISTVSLAARGITFKHLNHIIAPVEGNKPGTKTKVNYKAPVDRPDEAAISEMIVMLYREPNTWSYSKLALWLKEKTGREYRPNHISTLLRSRIPDLTEKQLVVGGRRVKQKNAILGRPSKVNRALKVVQHIATETKLSKEAILSDDDGFSEEEMAALIALEDARELELLNH